MNKKYYKIMMKTEATSIMIENTIRDKESELFKLLIRAKREFILLSDVLFLYNYNKDSISAERMSWLLNLSYIKVIETDYPSIIPSKIEASLEMGPNMLAILIQNINDNTEQLSEKSRLSFYEIVDYFDLESMSRVLSIDFEGETLCRNTTRITRNLPIRDYLKFIENFLVDNDHMKEYFIDQPYYAKVNIN